MQSLDTQFANARNEFNDTLVYGRKLERAMSCYNSAFHNPYAGYVREAWSALENAIQAFAPLIAHAIQAGHHGRWIKRRLPDDFRLILLYDHHYAADVQGLGVCIDNTLVDSGVSNREVYVQWLLEETCGYEVR